MAGIFYDGLILPYMAIEKFRKAFEYEITLSELDRNIEAGEINFSKDSYFKAVEKLTYTKQLFLKKNTELVVGLCLSDLQLEYYKDRDCIYRTIFRIKESEKKILSTIPLPENIFQLEIKINGEQLTPVMTEYDEAKGIKMVCKYGGEDISAAEESEFDIKVVTLQTRK